MRVDPLTGHQLWAEDYDEVPNPLLALEERELSQWLGDVENLSVADVACGTGRWMRLALRRKAHLVFGIDFSPRMLQRAGNQPGLAGQLIVARAEEIPLKSSCLDVLICSFALGYFPDLDLIAVEFQRLLKPKGLLFCSDFHPSAHQRNWKRSFKRDGISFEIDNTPHSMTDILNAFSRHFDLQRHVDLSLDKVDRPFFERADKLELYNQVRGFPAVILFQWQKKSNQTLGY